MRILRMLLKHPQLLGLTGWEFDSRKSNKGVRITEATRAEILRLIKQAHVFLIDVDLTLQAIRDSNGTIRDLPTSTPFETCWFETFTPGRQILPFSDVEGDSSHPLVIAQAGMLTKEVAPGIYDLFCMEITKDKQTSEPNAQLSVFRNVPEDMSFNDERLWSPQAALRLWLSALQKGALGVESTSAVVQVPRPDRISRTKPHIIQRVIRIVPKASRATTKPITVGGLIDWSHRWEVRGHWRKTLGVGKDRAGAYLIEGFTWVKQHIKGPEELQLVPKTRIVQ